MTPHSPRLTNDLSVLRGFLSKDNLAILPEEERLNLLKTADDLLEKLAAVEDEHLVVGILGGTGVGKSSLMNALAGSAISSVSHRRPHTEHVIIYRHQDSPPVQVPPPDILPWREILHQAGSVRHVLLADLPDFDSLLAAHRDSVNAFLEKLDLLVWVTSPEKYADRRFYEFLKQAPKARDNFFFLLNKADLLFQENTEGNGYKGLTAASAQFVKHLQDEGIDTPSVFLVSAREAVESESISSWNQFPVLRQQIFQLRNAKQVRAVKERNLDEEASRLFQRVRREAQGLENLSSALDKAVLSLKQDRPAWERMGRESLTPWLESRSVRDLFRPGRAGLPLSGPGLALALVFLRPTGDAEPEMEAEQRLSRLSPPDTLVSILRRRMDWIEDRVFRHLLEDDQSPAFRKRVMETLRLEERFEETGEKLFHAASERTSAPVLPGMIRFRVTQALTYAILPLLLIIALGDAAAWGRFLESPGVRSAIGLVSSFVQTLFSSKGLAALLSYALLNLFFGFRFFLSYRKRLNRATDKAVASLAEAMTDIWSEQLDAIVKDLEELRGEVEERRQVLDSYV